MRGQKGITLVALVVTIVVLLILAGVTLSLTLGSNGIISKAQSAQANWNAGRDAENTALKTLENEMLANIQ